MGVAGASSGQSRASSSSPGSRACSPARSAWPPASTSACRASASCSSARSRSSGPRWRRCPRRRRPSWPRSYRAKGFTRDEAGDDRAPHLRGPGARARHARPRGARARPRRARLAVGRGHRLVRRLRRRCGRARSCRSCSAAGRRVTSISLGLEPRSRCSRSAPAVSLLTGREPHLLRDPPARHRPGGGGRDLRRSARSSACRRAAPDRDGRRDRTPGTARRGGARPGRLVERPGRSLRRPRARLRQGHRGRLGVDRVRAAGTAPIDLAAGDRLELPAGDVARRRSSGPDGVACLEAHLPAGSLPPIAHHPAGTW